MNKLEKQVKLWVCDLHWVAESWHLSTECVALEFVFCIPVGGLDIVMPPMFFSTILINYVSLLAFLWNFPPSARNFFPSPSHYKVPSGNSVLILVLSHLPSLINHCVFHSVSSLKFWPLLIPNARDLVWVTTKYLIPAKLQVFWHSWFYFLFFFPVDVSQPQSDFLITWLFDFDPV